MSSKGQVVIPKEIRQSLRIGSGSILKVYAGRNKTI
ncbi:MAG: AbrB/MazE/SpoVT family DNA-binding domain-containing protein [Candidatus Thorarchaeota archaeon]